MRGTGSVLGAFFNPLVDASASRLELVFQLYVAPLKVVESGGGLEKQRRILSKSWDLRL